jgi:ligand-binding sensor domain-containing protein
VYQGGNWKRIGQGQPKIDDARWRCAYAAGDDAGVFFGSADGRVAVVRDNVLRTIDVPAELPSGRVRGLVRADDGVFCLSGPGVVHVDSSVTTVTVDDSPPGTDAIAVDAGGELWTVGRWGIHQRHDGSYTEFRHDLFSTVEPAFTAVVFDPANRMWTAVRTGAVFRYDGELWVKMGESEEVLGGPVDGLRAGDAGTVWAFSDVGVSRFDGREWTTFPADSLGGAVVDVALGPAGAVVAATRSRLWLFREDSAGWQPVSIAGSADVRPFVAPRSRAINRVVFDADGHMILGTDAGLALVGPGGVRWLGAADGIGGGAVIDLLVDPDRALWLGFRSDGVARIPWKSLW